MEKGDHKRMGLVSVPEERGCEFLSRGAVFCAGGCVHGRDVESRVRLSCVSSVLARPSLLCRCLPVARRVGLVVDLPIILQISSFSYSRETRAKRESPSWPHAAPQRREKIVGFAGYLLPRTAERCWKESSRGEAGPSGRIASSKGVIEAVCFDRGRRGGEVIGAALGGEIRVFNNNDELGGFEE